MRGDGRRRSAWGGARDAGRGPRGEGRRTKAYRLNADDATTLAVRPASRVPHPAPRYSYRSASTGSRRAARNAGMMPHTTPVNALTRSDAAMDVAGVDAGIDGHAVRTPTATSTPSTRPTAAPI